MIEFDRYLSSTGRQLHESAIRRMGTVVARAGDLVSFAPGYPDATAFPWPELQEIARRLLSGTDTSALQYGPTRGYHPLIEAITALLAQRGIRASTEQVIVTSGSQQGIDLLGRVLVSAGDVVLVELPTFTGAIAAFKNVQAEVVGVQQDEDGIRLEDLERVWQRERAAGKSVKLLYLVPNFQNPTGALMALDKRRQLIEWAARRDVLIVEDDPYGSLYFADAATEPETRPLRVDDDSGRVLYLSSFSKTLAPGLRVGWLVAPPALIERVDAAKQGADLASGTLDQRIAFEALRQGVVDQLAPRLRDRYQYKRTVMEGALRRQLGDRLTWPVPRGGFFIWATLPPGLGGTDLLERCFHRGVIFVVGSAFYVDGSGHDKIRLSFSAPTPDRIEEGVRRLAAAITAP